MIQVDAGEEITFYCDSVNTPKWYFRTTVGDPIQSHSFKHYLEIQNVQSAQGGYYFCYGSYFLNSDFFLAQAELIVYGKVYFDDSVFFHLM